MFARSAKLIGALLAGVLFSIAPAGAQGVVPLGSHPSADDLVRALSAPPGKTRGIVVRSSNPAATDAQPAAAAPSVALDVKFAFNSAILSPEAKDLVKQIAIAMNSDQLGRSRFLVEGHTDTKGTPEYNLGLSRQRAEAVRDELATTYGVKPSRLQIVGRGQQNLLDPANPESPTNRRVVIVNLGE